MTDRIPGLEPVNIENDEVERLLSLAGRRPRLPEHEVAAARAAARAAWRGRLARSRRRRAVQFVGLAASVALVALFVIQDRAFVPRPTPDSAPLGELLVRSGEVSVSGMIGSSQQVGVDTSIVTGRQGRAALGLSNGASLRIDVSTSVRLESQTRVALDRGAVYLDVHPSSTASSIVVDTPLGAVRHIGTQFEVRLLDAPVPGQPPVALRVAVREGKVLIDSGGSAIEADAGTELTLGADGSIARSAGSPRGDAWNWTQQVVPEHSIEGQTLAAYLAWVARETGLPFHYAEAGLEALAAETVLHGSIGDLAPEESLEVVLPSCGLTHTRAESGFWIERAATP